MYRACNTNSSRVCIQSLGGWGSIWSFFWLEDPPNPLQNFRRMTCVSSHCGLMQQTSQIQSQVWIFVPWGTGKNLLPAEKERERERESVKLLFSFGACFFVDMPYSSNTCFIQAPILNCQHLIYFDTAFLQSQVHRTPPWKWWFQKKQTNQINLSNLFFSCNEYVFPVPLTPISQFRDVSTRIHELGGSFKMFYIYCFFYIPILRKIWKDDPIYVNIFEVLIFTG